MKKIRMFFDLYGECFGSTIDFGTKEEAQFWLDEFNKRPDVVDGKSLFLFGANIEQ